ncbi:transporter substrate-binding domain-containing protein [Aureibacillus halotolerans]|uniref:Amino acid ABC transporter substrate-binding protein (PAAT family) n=1 Tax=Aureibacillus halotolerans TaxID=1508390 RepID=A0A4R6UAW4_9BACI|nr:transporter substrate-binding domain-containing protein [Aureibacillus halotolerans]TDQ43016.1 amino acid ABC transporter substrate-binding protein (PAAT family) [Aureibacillus halotolerans]
MKKTMGMLLFGIMLVVLAACGTSSQDGASGDNTDSSSNGEATDSGGETYVVATDNNFVPFEFVDQETDELTGFDVELMRAIAEEAGFNVEFEQIEFSGLISGVSTGRYDIGIAGITINDERKEKVDFSDPYYDSGLTVAVLEGNEEIQSVEDLAGKTVGTRTGSTSQEYLAEELPDANVEAYPEITTAYQSLLTNKIDAVLYDLPNVQYYSKTEGGGKILAVGDRLTGESYGMVFEKGSELTEQVNTALQTLKDNGTYDEIHAKWFGE